MSDYTGESKQVHPNVLARWLVLNGYAEDVRGYGHVTGDDLAEALLAHYDIRPRAGADSGSSRPSTNLQA